MKLLVSLYLLFSLQLWAAEFRYDSYEMKSPPAVVSENYSLFFSQQGFYSLADQNHGIPSLGINQVYFKNQNQFVMVKHEISGSYPLNELVHTPKGFMIHLKDSNQVSMLYFRGFSREATLLLVNRLKDSSTYSSLKKIKNLIIPEAYANCAESFGNSSLGSTNQKMINSVSSAAAWDMVKSCLTGLGEGAWDSTGGLIKGIGSEIVDFVSHPIDYVEKVADKVELFLVKTANFIKQLITDPEKAFSNIGAGVGGAWTQVKNTVSSMSTQMKVQFVCSFIASIGVDAAIAFLTGGAATGKIVITISNLAKKFSRVGKLLKTLGKMDINFLSKLNFDSKKMELFMKKLMGNKIPDGDLSYLNQLAHSGDELSLRTLSCYIR